MASPYEQKIWDFLVDKLGNEYGAAGLMGNLFAESGLYPDRVEGDIPYSSVSQTYTSLVDAGLVTEDDFVHNGSGYGLAQWTYYTRKQDLWNTWKTGWPSIGDIDMQLNFLYGELTILFPSVLSTLKSATSIRQASDKVLHDFENPADQSVSVEELRESYGQGYYNRFASGTGGGGGTVDPDPTPTPTPTPTNKKRMSLLMMYAATRRRF